jgi:hypothetical protein
MNALPQLKLGRTDWVHAASVFKNAYSEVLRTILFEMSSATHNNRSGCHQFMVRGTSTGSNRNEKIAKGWTATVGALCSTVGSTG